MGRVCVVHGQNPESIGPGQPLLPLGGADRGIPRMNEHLQLLQSDEAMTRRATVTSGPRRPRCSMSFSADPIQLVVGHGVQAVDDEEGGRRVLAQLGALGLAPVPAPTGDPVVVTTPPRPGPDVRQHRRRSRWCRRAPPRRPDQTGRPTYRVKSSPPMGTWCRTESAL